MKHNLISILKLKFSDNVDYEFTEMSIKTYENLNWLMGIKPTINEIDNWISEENTKYLLTEVRAQRNIKLASTDWRFRSDLPTIAEWVQYCQELRDLPADSTKFSLNDNGDVIVQWPTINN